jgi:hypothetical protein
VDEKVAPSKLGEAATWQASSQLNGSPGAAEPSLINLSATLSVNGVTIRFSGRPGGSYVPQRRSDLATGVWESLAPLSAAADGSVEFNDPVAGAANYYRFQIGN